MLGFIQKYGIKNPMIRGIFFSFIGLILYRSALHPNTTADVKHFQNIFQEKVNFLEAAIEDFGNAVNYGDERSIIWNNTLQFNNQGHEYFVYHKDSLLYWTSSHVSLQKSHYQATKREIVLLENGWYYKAVRHAGDYSIIGLFLIKSEFPYENDNLVNDFSKDFDFAYLAKIDNIPDDLNIKYSDGELAFSVSEIHAKNPKFILELLIFLFFMLGIVEISKGMWTVFKSYPWPGKAFQICIGILGVLGLRALLYYVNWKQFFSNFDMLNPNIFASSSWAPTPADLIINMLVLLLLARALIGLVNLVFKSSQPNTFWSKLIFLMTLILFYLASHYTTYYITEIILNSDVPLDFYNFMSLSPISFLFLLIFFALLWVYFKISTLLVLKGQNLYLPINTKGMLWFVATVIFIILEVFVLNNPLIFGIFPIALSLLLIFFHALKKSSYKFTEVIGILVLFSFYLSGLLNHTQNQKELSNRAVYAKKLLSEKELETELEYAITADLLKNSQTLQKFLKSPDLTQESEIKRYIERKYLQGYWNRYDIDIYLYDNDTLPISTYVQINDDPAKHIEDIIARVGLLSDVSDYIFYVSDFSDNLSYVVRQPIKDSLQNNLGILYLGLRSKIIPQEIGFPRLLLNDNSKVFFKLENYDMAKYVRGKLALRYGSYNYPLTIGSFLLDLPKKSGIVSQDKSVHLITHGESNKTLILTKEGVNFEQYLTTFSFLFSTFGLIILLALLFSGKIFSRWKSMKLAFRIQLLFIALVFFSLLFSGIGTGAYVKHQYLSYQEDQLREKVSSVQKELQTKLENEEHLDEPILSNFLEYLLNKFSTIFVTDINLYNTEGKLLASSRPEIFNLGLLSSQMNALAFRKMFNNKLSLYVGQEYIGNQEYLSAYVPLTNAKKQIIAYINLPYFAKQSNFDDEIAGFLSAIINIFVLLLALSIVIAVFVSSKIVDPLKKIQESLSDFKLGKSQQPIEYKGNDEIGVLVQEYNTKLKELQASSEKLAKTEREMAWREMAKQVAHEIKNPLTPMKLRIQHFQRAFDPKSENAKERIQNFSESLIEQIDALTHIANAFSNFAKMPKTQMEIIDAVRVMNNAVETFSSEDNVEIAFNTYPKVIEIEADKELMLRVFNNLIKNAIQAIPQDRLGIVQINMLILNGNLEIRIKDNGIGISDEMHDKIFVPNFTTKSTGTGLGLAMVKQIVASHQGTIGFQSQPGQTIFSILLPLKQP
jgi:signal transduction histidine kinase